MEIIDSELRRKHFAGTYLVEDSGEIALIEVSTTHAIPKILSRLKKLGFTKEQVKYIFVTHIHLDHASGAGSLLKELPKAKLIVHPSGAKHLIDPIKLIAGANAVYSEEAVKKDYGTIVPANPAQVIECQHLEIFPLGKITLTTLHTPGHARHHISILDNATNGIFTGDSFGLCFPEMDVNGRKFYQPTTAPTAFEYDKMLESIDLMSSYNPQKLYLTHYGISDNPLDVKKQIIKRLLDYKELVKSIDINGINPTKELEEKFKKYYILEARTHGVTLLDREIIKLFDIDIKLNSMGLVYWKKLSLKKD